MDLSSRRAAFKKVITEADARKSRAQVNNDVRKNKLLEAHMKRRNVAMTPTPEEAAPPALPFTPIITKTLPAAKPADVTLLANYVAGEEASSVCRVPP